MVPPKVSNTQRGNLTGLVSGAMIYNTTSDRIEVFLPPPNGSGGSPNNAYWVGIATVA